MIAVSAITLALYLASIVRDELGAVPQPVQHLFSDFLMHTFPVPANLTVTTTTASTSSPTPMPTQTTTLPPPEPGRLDVLQLHVPKDCGRGQSLRSLQGDKLQVGYVGRLSDGEVFDSTAARSGGKPFSFTLGQQRVIAGWEQGLLCMCIGEKRRLTIPPQLGYGMRGAPPHIPGGATLTYIVELFGMTTGALHDATMRGRTVTLWQQASKRTTPEQSSKRTTPAVFDTASRSCIVPGSPRWKRCRTHSLLGAWSACAISKVHVPNQNGGSAAVSCPVPMLHGVRFRKRQNLRCDAGTGFRMIMVQLIQQRACCFHSASHAVQARPSIPPIDSHAQWVAHAPDRYGMPLQGVSGKAYASGLRVDVHGLPPPACRGSRSATLSAWPHSEQGAHLHVRYAGWIYWPHANPSQRRGLRIDAATDTAAKTMLNFTLGQHTVIPGWEYGLQNMCVGEERILRVPPDLAYGSQGAGSLIPPNSWLLFCVVLDAVNGVRAPITQTSGNATTLTTARLRTVSTLAGAVAPMLHSIRHAVDSSVKALVQQAASGFLSALSREPRAVRKVEKAKLAARAIADLKAAKHMLQREHNAAEKEELLAAAEERATHRIARSEAKAATQLPPFLRRAEHAELAASRMKQKQDEYVNAKRAHSESAYLRSEMRHVKDMLKAPPPPSDSIIAPMPVPYDLQNSEIRLSNMTLMEAEAIVVAEQRFANAFARLQATERERNILQRYFAEAQLGS